MVGNGVGSLLGGAGIFVGKELDEGMNVLVGAHVTVGAFVNTTGFLVGDTGVAVGAKGTTVGAGKGGKVGNAIGDEVRRAAGVKDGATLVGGAR